MSAAEIDRVMADTGMDRMQAVNHVRGREILRLRLGSPKRAPAGAVIQQQHNTDELGLFQAANEPRLF